jgi:hypothetical protein
MVRPAEFNAAHFYFTRITLIRINIGRREAHTYKKQPHGAALQRKHTNSILISSLSFTTPFFIPSSPAARARVCMCMCESTMSSAPQYHLALDNLDPIFVRKWLFYLA